MVSPEPMCSMDNNMALASQIIKDAEKSKGCNFLGLDFVLEIPKKGENNFKKCKYFCSLCVRTVTAGSLVSHLLCYQHNMQYMKMVFPSVHVMIISEPRSSHNGYLTRLNKLIKNYIGLTSLVIETTDGVKKNKENLVAKISNISKHLSYYDSIEGENLELLCSSIDDISDKAKTEICGNESMSSEENQHNVTDKFGQDIEMPEKHVEGEFHYPIDKTSEICFSFKEGNCPKGNYPKGNYPKDVTVIDGKSQAENKLVSVEEVFDIVAESPQGEINQEKYVSSEENDHGKNELDTINNPNLEDKDQLDTENDSNLENVDQLDTENDYNLENTDQLVTENDSNLENKDLVDTENYYNLENTDQLDTENGSNLENTDQLDTENGSNLENTDVLDTESDSYLENKEKLDDENDSNWDNIGLSNVENDYLNEENEMQGTFIDENILYFEIDYNIENDDDDINKSSDEKNLAEHREKNNIESIGQNESKDKPHKQENDVLSARLCNFEGCEITLIPDDNHSLCLTHRDCFNTSIPSIMASKCLNCLSYFKSPIDRFVKYLKSLLKHEYCKRLRSGSGRYKALFNGCKPLSISKENWQFITNILPRIKSFEDCAIPGCTNLMIRGDLHNLCIRHRSCFKNFKLNPCSICEETFDSMNEHDSPNTALGITQGWFYFIRNLKRRRFVKHGDENIWAKPEDEKCFQLKILPNLCGFKGCEISLNINDLHSACLQHRECFNVGLPSILPSECQTCHSYFDGDNGKFRNWLISLMKSDCCTKQRDLGSNFEFLFDKCDSSMLSESKLKIIKEDPTKISDRICDFKRCGNSLSTNDLHTSCICHMKCFIMGYRSLLLSKCQTCYSYFTGDDEGFEKWLFTLKQRSCGKNQQDLEPNFEFLFRKCDISMFSDSKLKIIKKCRFSSTNTSNDFKEETTLCISNTPQSVKNFKKICDSKGCSRQLNCEDLHSACMVHRVCFNYSSASLVTSECPICISFFKGTFNRFKNYLHSLGKHECCSKLRIHGLSYESLFKECNSLSLSKDKQKFIKEVCLCVCDDMGCDINLKTIDIHPLCPRHRKCFSTYKHCILNYNCGTCHSYFNGDDDRFRDWCTSLLDNNCCRKQGYICSNFECLFINYDYSKLSTSKQKIIKKITIRHCDFEGCEIPLNSNDLHSECLAHRVCFNTSSPSFVTAECPTCHSYFKGTDQQFIKYLTSLVKHECCKELKNQRLPFDSLFKECEISLLNESKQKFIKEKTNWICSFKGCETFLNTNDLHTICIMHRKCFSMDFRSLRETKCQTCQAYFAGDEEEFRKWLFSLKNGSCHNKQQELESNLEFLFCKCDSSVLSESKQKIIKGGFSSSSFKDFEKKPTVESSETLNPSKDSTRVCDSKGCSRPLNFDDPHSACLMHRVCFNTSSPSLVTSECPMCLSYFEGTFIGFKTYLYSLGRNECCSKLRTLGLSYESLFKECNSLSLSKDKQKFIKEVCLCVCDYMGCEINLKTLDIHPSCPRHRKCFNTSDHCILCYNCGTCRSYFNGDDDKFSDWLTLLLESHCCLKQGEPCSNFECLFINYDCSKLSESKQRLIKKGPKTPLKRVRDNSSNQEDCLRSKKHKITVDDLKKHSLNVDNKNKQAEIFGNQYKVIENSNSQNKQPIISCNPDQRPGNFENPNQVIKNINSQNKQPIISCNPDKIPGNFGNPNKVIENFSSQNKRPIISCNPDQRPGNFRNPNQVIENINSQNKQPGIVCDPGQKPGNFGNPNKVIEYNHSRNKGPIISCNPDQGPGNIGNPNHVIENINSQNKRPIISCNPDQRPGNFGNPNQVIENINSQNKRPRIWCDPDQRPGNSGNQNHEPRNFPDQNLGPGNFHNKHQGHINFENKNQVDGNYRNFENINHLPGNYRKSNEVPRNFGNPHPVNSNQIAEHFIKTNQLPGNSNEIAGNSSQIYGNFGNGQPIQIWGTNFGNSNQIYEKFSNPNQLPVNLVRPNLLPGNLVRPNQLPVIVVRPNQLPGNLVRPNQLPGNLERPNQLPGNLVRPNQLPGNLERPNQLPGYLERPNQLPGNLVRPNQLHRNLVRPNQLSGNFERPNQLPGNFERPNQLPGNFERPSQLPGNLVRPNQLPGNLVRPNQLPGKLVRPNHFPESSIHIPGNSYPIPENYLNRNQLPGNVNQIPGNPDQIPKYFGNRSQLPENSNQIPGNFGNPYQIDENFRKQNQVTGNFGNLNRVPENFAKLNPACENINQEPINFSQNSVITDPIQSKSLPLKYSPLFALNMMCEAEEYLTFLVDPLIKLRDETATLEARNANPLVLFSQDENVSLIDMCIKKLNKALARGLDKLDQMMVESTLKASSKLVTQIETFLDQII